MPGIVKRSSRLLLQDLVATAVLNFIAQSFLGYFSGDDSYR
jgi:hypothetical protein